MKHASCLIVSSIVLVLMLSACGATEARVATAIAQTETAKPTSTFTPAPTATPTPVPTPTIEILDVVNDTYSNIRVIYRDDFDHVLPGFSPLGWRAENGKLFVYTDGSLEVNGGHVVGFFENETITVNEAIVVRFKFAPKSIFTIGIDGTRQGVRIHGSQNGFRSVSMEFRNSLRAYFNSDRNRYPARFEGDLNLLPDVWYMCTLGFAEGKQFIIKIWDPENSDQVLTHRRQVDDMTNTNLFIVWVDQNATLYLDDFTIIKFTNLK